MYKIKPFYAAKLNKICIDGAPYLSRTDTPKGTRF